MSTSAYVLGTTESIVRWYCFNINQPERPLPFELHVSLDLGKVPQFGDKKKALGAAQALGLKSWRYVRL